MNQFQIKSSKLSGIIHTPPSKSHTLRAILFGSMGSGKSIIHNYLASSDTSAMIEACRHLGANIDISPTQITIIGNKGKIKYSEDVIYAGNSGIILRFFTALGALCKHPIVITGDHSIRHNRPMVPLLNALKELGVSAVSTRDDGYAPIIIKGPITQNKTTVEGSDSQHVSALLIAAAFAGRELKIDVLNPGEIPWVNLTLSWFDKLGISYKNDAFKSFSLKGDASYDGFEYTVPGDFSSAAFPIAAALITGSEITICNIDMEDAQGDKALISYFHQMGAKIEYDKALKTLFVAKTKELNGQVLDINPVIDAVTILAVVACFATGETHLKNCAIARHKECDRLNSITSELKKMGADIRETPDGLIIKKSALKGAQVNSYKDHRMAMSLSVAALAAKDETTVCDTDCVKKTFPSFVKDFHLLGASIRVT